MYGQAGRRRLSRAVRAFLDSQGNRAVTKLLAAAFALATGFVVSRDALALPAVQQSPGVSHAGVAHGGRHPPRGRGASVHAFNFQVVGPRDASSGLPTGKRLHKPYAAGH